MVQDFLLIIICMIFAPISLNSENLDSKDEDSSNPDISSFSFCLFNYLYSQEYKFA